MEKREGASRKAAMNASPNPGRAGTTGVDRPPFYTSRELFGAARLVSIVHDGQVYRMQITRMGKLILTK